MRVLVCGGRNYFNSVVIYNALNKLRDESKIDCLIEGGATGADAIAKVWAKALKIQIDEFKAEWTRLGDAAGPLRNQRMIDEGKPDLVLAFPGGKGTADMVHRARLAGIKVVEISGYY